jgi:hypothetical protein
MIRMTTAALAAFALSALVALPVAAKDRTAPDTPATDIHGAPGNTPGFGGSSANPDGRGKGKNGGQGIHNISGGSPGQGGDVTPGEKGGPSNDMHGGLDATTGRFD